MKYERIQEPTDSKPGVVRVYTERILEDGTKETVTDEFNTVSYFSKVIFNLRFPESLFFCLV